MKYGTANSDTGIVSVSAYVVLVGVLTVAVSFLVGLGG